MKSKLMLAMILLAATQTQALDVFCDIDTASSRQWSARQSGTRYVFEVMGLEVDPISCRSRWGCDRTWARNYFEQVFLSRANLNDLAFSGHRNRLTIYTSRRVQNGRYMGILEYQRSQIQNDIVKLRLSCSVNR